MGTCTANAVHLMQGHKSGATFCFEDFLISSAICFLWFSLTGTYEGVKAASKAPSSYSCLHPAPCILKGKCWATWWVPIRPPPPGLESAPQNRWGWARQCGCPVLVVLFGHQARSLDWDLGSLYVREVDCEKFSKKIGSKGLHHCFISHFASD